MVTLELINSSVPFIHNYVDNPTIKIPCPMYLGVPCVPYGTHSILSHPGALALALALALELQHGIGLDVHHMHTWDMIKCVDMRF